MALAHTFSRRVPVMGDWYEAFTRVVEAVEMGQLPSREDLTVLSPALVSVAVEIVKARQFIIPIKDDKGNL